MADRDSSAEEELATLDEAATLLRVTKSRIIQLLDRQELEPAGAKLPGKAYWPRGVGRVSWEELRRYQAVYPHGRRGRRKSPPHRTSDRKPTSGPEAAALELKIGLDQSREALAVERGANAEMIRGLETVAAHLKKGFEALRAAQEALIDTAVSDAAALADQAERLDDLCGRYSAALGPLLTPDDASDLAGDST